MPQVEAHFVSCMHGPDAAEGMAAFREGRPADWRTGRAGEGRVPAED